MILKIYINTDDLMAENLPVFYGVYLFEVTLVVKNLPAKARGSRDVGLIPGSRRSPGEGNGNPLQYSCLESSMNRGACQATVHGVEKSQT